MANTPNLEIPEQEIYSFLKASKRRQLLWTIGVLVVGIGALVLLRIAMLGLENTLYIGPIACSAMLALFLAVKNGYSTDAASVIILALFVSGLFGLGLLSGGIDGPIIVGAPFVPILAALLHGRTAAIVTAVMVGTIVLGFAMAPAYGYEFRVDQYQTGQRTLARAGFILAFIVASTFIAFHHSRLRDAMAASIWQHANKDHLTGVANRRKIDSTLEREIRIAVREKSPVSVLLIDIDWFKQYNDTNGHLMGDACLQAIAQQLRQTLERPADLLGRFGGEEFIAILPNTSLSGSAGIAERMRAAVRTLGVPYEPNGKELITVSIGVAVAYLPQHYHSAKLLELADEALYKAKENGRNRVEIAGNIGNVTSIPAANAANDRSGAKSTSNRTKSR